MANEPARRSGQQVQRRRTSEQDQGSQRSAQAQQTPQDRFVRMLVERISEERYPSATMMSYVEQNLVRQDQWQAYINVLLDKIEDDRFPSIDLMRRVQRLVG